MKAIVLRVLRTYIFTLFLCLHTLLALGQAQSWRTLNRAAGKLVNQGKYEDAVPVLEEALAAARDQYGLDNNYTKLAEKLITAYERTGRHALIDSMVLALSWEEVGAKAQEALLAGDIATAGYWGERMVRVSERSFGKFHGSYCISLSTLGDIYTKQWRYEEAKALLIECRARTIKVFGKRHDLYPTVLYQLGSLYSEMGQYESAEGLLLEAMDYWVRIKGKDDEDYARVLADMGFIFAMRGQDVLAEPMYVEALSLLKAQVTPKTSPQYYIDDPNYLIVVHRLANLKLRSGDTQVADTLYTHLEEYALLGLSGGHPLLGVFLADISAWLVKQGKYQDAQQYYGIVLAMEQARLRREFAIVPASASQHAFRQVYQTQDRFQTLAAEAAAQLPKLAGMGYNARLSLADWQVSQYNRLAYAVANHEDWRVKALWPQWKAYKQWIAYREHLSNEQQQLQLALTNLDPAYQREQAQRQERRLQLLSGFSQEPPFATWQQVQAALKPGEAAVEVVRYEPHDPTAAISPFPVRKNKAQYLAYVLTHDAPKPQVVALGNGEALEGELYTRYLEARTTPDPYLANEYWQPLDSALGTGIKRVYFAADGVYQLMNLDILALPEGGYLGDNIDIECVTRTSDILEHHHIKPTERKLTLMGGLNYDKGNKAATEAPLWRPYEGAVLTALTAPTVRIKGVKWAAKPATTSTVNSFSRWGTQQGWQVQEFTGQEGIEAAIRQLDNPRVLQLATHTYFGPATYNHEFEDADAPMAYNPTPAVVGASVLAGAQGYQDSRFTLADDDGLLLVHEAASLPLQGTELVVLTGSQTVLVEPRYAFVVGQFYRAFHVAGANSLLVQLWEVPEEVSTAFVAAFYEEWLQNGLPKRKAFLEARRRQRKQFPNPQEWGCLQLVGE